MTVKGFINHAYFLKSIIRICSGFGDNVDEKKWINDEVADKPFQAV